MEVYEMPITLEEARNYHKVIYQLKMLSPVEWIKTYIYTVIFSSLNAVFMRIIGFSISNFIYIIYIFNEYCTYNVGFNQYYS